MNNYVKNKRLGFGSVSLRYGHIRNVLFAHKDGKNRHFQKTKGHIYHQRQKGGGEINGIFIEQF